MTDYKKLNLIATSSPHIRGNFRTNRIMADVMLALTPALAVGVVRFGMDALILTLVTMATAVAAEWLYSKLTKTRNTTVDGSALVTGMLLAMTLPHTCPLWLAALGSVFAILFVKSCAVIRNKHRHVSGTDNCFRAFNTDIFNHISAFMHTCGVVEVEFPSVDF